MRPELPVLLLLLVAGCDQAMSAEGRSRPLQESPFFADGRNSRVPPEGTVAQGDLRVDEALYRGREGGRFAAEFPFPIAAADLARGRERYEIFCSPCHDRTGSGRGIIVERGYRAPPPFHVDRLRAAPVGELYDVITRGRGAMPGYADQVPVRDRWRIVGYLRALQASRGVPVDALPPAERARLEAEPR